MEALTTGEAARLLACSSSALYKLVARRKIPLRKQGKKIVFLGSELEQCLNQLAGHRLEDVLEKAAVSGGGNTLYPVEALQPNAPAMLVEGVLDALAIAQEVADLVAVVAAGSTTRGRLERWVGWLALAPVVLVAFDADQAGAQAAAWWQQDLGARARCWRPY